MTTPEAQRVKAVADGASPYDVYGGEWCLDPALKFREDLSSLLAEVERLRGEPTVESLRDLAYRLDPADQHQLAGMIAVNVGYELREELDAPDSPHSELKTLRATAERMGGLLRRFLTADREAPEYGLTDCEDCRGVHYKSADLEALIIETRAALQPQPGQGEESSG